MNRVVYLILFFLLINSCSFDSKTGIWTGSKNISKKKNEINNNIELVFKKENNVIQDRELSLEKNLKLETSSLFTSWTQSYQNKFNYTGNVSFLNNGNYKKFSKISRVPINKDILLKNNNLYFSDIKGNIGIFSLEDNKLIYKFNFYKKKYKKINKNIKLIIKGDHLIAADNFGYIYSIDYKNNKLNWAKNFLVPFRSNLKIIGKTLFLSDEKNKIVLINLDNGKKIEEFYTQPSTAVSSFENNLAIDDYNNLLFLSTNGSLYSLNLINQKTINWIQNFKSENEIIFNGKPITILNDHIMITSDNSISLINVNGAKIWSINIKSNVRPIISGNTIFVINQDNYLVLIDKVSGQIIFSKNLNTLLKKNFAKLTKKIKKIDYFFLNNNNLLLISDNSYFIEIDIGNSFNISSVKKNPFNIKTNLIFVKNEIIFVSESNKVFKVN